MSNRAEVARRMTAIEQWHAGRKARRIPQLVAGLVGHGAGVMLLVESALGGPSWSVLSEGVAEQTGTSFGAVTTAIGLVVLLFWIPLRELPGLGTILNVLLVGATADVTALVLPAPSTLTHQLAYFLAGLLLLTYSDAVYLGSRFGSGPRDGLMTGAVRVTGQPLWLVRTTIELVVLTTGWLLGGTAGLGTLLVAVTLGPLVHRFLRHTTVQLPGDSVRT